MMTNQSNRELLEKARDALDEIVICINQASYFAAMFEAKAALVLITAALAEQEKDA